MQDENVSLSSPSGDCDFYAGVVKTGHVLEATLGETPETWASILGSDFVDDRGEARWRRDYGLVELNFQQTVGIWACVGISVRVHRLITGRAEVVPTPLTRAHGTFPTRLPFETFTARVHQEGLRLKVMEGACGSTFHRYTALGPELRVEVITAETGTSEASNVWSITVT